VFKLATLVKALIPRREFGRAIARMTNHAFCEQADYLNFTLEGHFHKLVEFLLLRERVLRRLAQVGREFEGGYATVVVSHENNGMPLIERNLCELSLLNDLLLAHRFVLVLVEIEHMHLAIAGGRSPTQDGTISGWWSGIQG